MIWEFIKNKKNVLLSHIVIILAVLGSSEPFDRADISPWVMIISLGLLFIYYFMTCGIKLKYIPVFDIFVTFCGVLFWGAMILATDKWSNITGWDILVYLLYPFIIGVFFICQLAMNLVVGIIKWVQAKK